VYFSYTAYFLVGVDQVISCLRNELNCVVFGMVKVTHLLSFTAFSVDFLVRIFLLHHNVKVEGKQTVILLRYHIL